MKYHLRCSIWWRRSTLQQASKGVWPWITDVRKDRTIPNDSSPCDIFYFSHKSPKTAKIETKLLLLSVKIGCDVWLMNHLKLYSIGALMQHLGLNTGAGKPTELPKRVMRVQVRFSFLAHHGTPLPVPWYFGYVRVNSNKVILIFTVFFLFSFGIFSVNSSRHTVTEPIWLCQPRIYLGNPLSPLTLTPIPLQKQCKS